jgi:hypothetical protein
MENKRKAYRERPFSKMVSIFQNGRLSSIPQDLNRHSYFHSVSAIKNRPFWKMAMVA